MKPLHVPTTPPEIVIQGEHEANLINRLCDAKAIRYFGRGWALRAEVLAQMQTGSRSLSDIGREYHVSKQAVSRIAKRARAIYRPSTGG
jgi:hypothetical protein